MICETSLPTRVSAFPKPAQVHLLVQWSAASSSGSLVNGRSDTLQLKIEPSPSLSLCPLPSPRLPPPLTTRHEAYCLNALSESTGEEVRVRRQLETSKPAATPHERLFVAENRRSGCGPRHCGSSSGIDTRSTHYLQEMAAETTSGSPCANILHVPGNADYVYRGGRRSECTDLQTG